MAGERPPQVSRFVGIGLDSIRPISKEEFERRGKMQLEEVRLEKELAERHAMEAKSRFCAVGMDGIRIIPFEEHKRRAKLRDAEVQREQELAATRAQERKKDRGAKRPPSKG